MNEQLLWGMRWAARTIEMWIASFGRATAERMCREASFLNGLGCEEHRAAMRTAWGA